MSQNNLWDTRLFGDLSQSSVEIGSWTEAYKEFRSWVVSSRQLVDESCECYTSGNELEDPAISISCMMDYYGLHLSTPSSPVFHVDAAFLSTILTCPVEELDSPHILQIRDTYWPETVYPGEYVFLYNKVLASNQGHWLVLHVTVNENNWDTTIFDSLRHVAEEGDEVDAEDGMVGVAANLKERISRLFGIPTTTSSLRYGRCAQQHNGVDCGVYATENVKSILFGALPAAHVDVSSIRPSALRQIRNFCENADFDLTTYIRVRRVEVLMGQRLRPLETIRQSTLHGFVNQATFASQGRREQLTKRMGTKKAAVTVHTPKVTVKPTASKLDAKRKSSEAHFAFDTASSKFRRVLSGEDHGERRQVDLWREMADGPCSEGHSDAMTTGFAATLNYKALKNALLLNIGEFDKFEENLIPAGPTAHHPVSFKSFSDTAATYANHPKSLESRAFVFHGIANGKTLPLSFSDATGPTHTSQWVTTQNVDSFLWTGMDLPLTTDINVIPYPSRSNTVNRHNHIMVTIDGLKMNVSQLPNVEFGATGFLAKARVNVFFPAMRRRHNEEKKARWVNYVEDDTCKWWYEGFLLPALKETLTNPSIVVDSFPPTYSNAASKARAASGKIGSVGYTVAKENVTLLINNLRKRVAGAVDGAQFKGFFFHLSMRDMKVGADAAFGDPLQVFFQKYLVLDLGKVNWYDCYIDIGYDFAVDPSWKGAPMTVLWNGHGLSAAVHGHNGWRMPTHDTWCHTDSVFGLRAEARQDNLAHCTYLSAYHKDKNLTYRKAGDSIGADFTAEDLAHRTPRYENSCRFVLDAWKGGATMSHGARIEYRCSLWAAAAACEYGSVPLLESLLSLDCFVVVESPDVYRFKASQMSILMATARLLSGMPDRERQLAWRLNFAYYLKYLMHGYVKRPDDMSYPRELARSLGLQFGQTQTNRPVISLALTDFNIKDLVLKYDGRVGDVSFLLGAAQPPQNRKVLKTFVAGGQRVKTSTKKTATNESSLPESSPVPPNLLPSLLYHPPPPTATAPSVTQATQAQVSVRQVCKEALRLMTQELWLAFPPGHKKPEVAELPRPPWDMKDLITYVRDPCWVERSHSATWQHRFEQFFGQTESSYPYAWEKVRRRPIEFINNVIASQHHPGFTVRLMNELKRRFNSIAVLPAGDKSRPWRTRRAVEGGGTRLLFAINPFDLPQNH